MFETVVTIGDCGEDTVIKEDEKNGDGLNFLAGRTMSFVNRKAFEGTVLAHTDGGVPNLVIEVEKADEENLEGSSISLKRHARYRDICWVSTRSISPVLRATRRTCLPCSESPDTRSRERLSKRE